MKPTNSFGVGHFKQFAMAIDNLPESTTDYTHRSLRLSDAFDEFLGSLYPFQRKGIDQNWESIDLDSQPDWPDSLTLIRLHDFSDQTLALARTSAILSEHTVAVCPIEATFTQRVWQSGADIKESTLEKLLPLDELNRTHRQLVEQGRLLFAPERLSYRSIYTREDNTKVYQAPDWFDIETKGEMGRFLPCSTFLHQEEITGMLSLRRYLLPTTSGNSHFTSWQRWAKMFCLFGDSPT